MSTINTETLKLYKNDKLYNGSRYQVYLTGRNMDTYLGTPDYQKTVTYKSIDEPIPINEPIKNCDEYTYGSITNDGKTYYFFVDYITTDAYKQTVIYYTIDWWTTNWFNINCTTAHILRQNKSKPGYIEQPFTPLYTVTDEEQITDDYVFMATYIPSSERGTSYISTIVLDGNDYNSQIIDAGNWYSKLDIPGADIKDCFAVPFFTIEDFIKENNTHEIYLIDGETTLENIKKKFIREFSGLLPLQQGKYYHIQLKNVDPSTTQLLYTAYYDSSETDDVKVITGWRYSPPELSSTLYEYNLYYVYAYDEDNILRYLQSEQPMLYLVENAGKIVEAHNTEKTIVSKTLNKTFVSNEAEKQGIKDWNGNIIWECPYGKTITGFTVTLLKGISHVMLQFIPTNTDLDTQSAINTGFGFNYDCRHPGLFVDSYQDYVLKNREYDIAMRHIQADKEVWTQAAATIEGVGYGVAFGKGLGGVSAGVGGVAETAARYIINNEFNPRIQQQYDQLYQRMSDQISLVGDAITNLYIEKSLSKYSLIMDTPSQDRMNTDITINGYYTDETTPTLQSSYFAIGRVLQADNVIVEGACNVVGKQQVVSRLMNGVEFI